MFTVLVIDDERIFPFSDDVRVTYARTSGEACGVLYHGPSITEVWFDHDLGGDDTGMKVIEYMEQTNLDGTYWADRIGRAYVHTMNTVAAPRMVTALRNMGIDTLRVTLPEGTTTIHA